MFSCDICSKVFTRKDSMQRHSKIHDGDRAHQVCNICNTNFTRKESLKRHLLHCEKLQQPPAKRSKLTPSNTQQTRPSVIQWAAAPSTSTVQHRCDICKLVFNSTLKYNGHLRSQSHKRNVNIELVDEGVEKIIHAFKNRLASYRVQSKEDITDVEAFMVSVKSKILKLIEAVIIHHTSIKFNVELFGYYHKPYSSPDEEPSLKSFNTKFSVVNQGSNLGVIYTSLMEIIRKKSEEFQVGTLK